MRQPFKFIDKHGTTYYYKDKDSIILHRLDGPAIITKEGHMAWYMDGDLHRLDGPAIEGVDFGDEATRWYAYGWRHRVDGPAVEYRDGERSWWVNGKFLCTVDSNGKITDRMEP